MVNAIGTFGLFGSGGGAGMVNAIGTFGLFGSGGGAGMVNAIGTLGLFGSGGGAGIVCATGALKEISEKIAFGIEFPAKQVLIVIVNKVADWNKVFTIFS